MSGDEGAAGGAAKGGRDLRHKGRKDYAAMHKGVEVHPSMTEDELDELDSLVTAESELNTTDSEVTELSLGNPIVKNTGVTPKAVASGSKNPDDEVLKLEQELCNLGLQSQNTTEDSSTDSLNSSSSESSDNESSSSSASSKSKKHKKKTDKRGEELKPSSERERLLLTNAVQTTRARTFYAYRHIRFSYSKQDFTKGKLQNEAI